MNGKLRIPALVAVVALLLLPLAGVAGAADGPTLRLSTSQAGTGGSVTVSGTGWRAHALLMLLVCGQATPARGVIGGTNSCANADGRAVTTDAEGAFSKKLPVAEPPVPCPCVVHAATVTGAEAQADAVFQVAGHDVEPLPAEPSGGRLSVLSDTRLDGSSGLLTWFGAPPARTLVFTVGNAGTSAVRNPVFQVGTSHGVFAPQWDDQEWRGTIQPGRKARIELPVELTGGAHGDYTVSLKYGGKVLAEQPWGVGRPWGVTLFWVLVCVVVPAAVFRAGMAVVDRIRPRRAGGLRHRGLRLPELTLRMPKFTTRADAEAPPAPTTLPWFTPDSDPGAAGRLSAPHDDSPTSPTTPTRKGPP
ncbi:neocarzinostatin apoprotein domain-containing protein [Streptomyces sp. 7R007]